MKNLRFIYLSIIICCFSAIYAQKNPFFYFIQLKDKTNSPFSLNNPSAYLSDKAQERRLAMNIPIDSTDLPVNPQYINEIKNTGAEIFGTSRWLNGVTVRIADTITVLPQLRNLIFVEKMEYTGKDVTTSFPIPYGTQQIALLDSGSYGNALTQINQMNLLALHSEGYRGAGIEVAVIDAGFINVQNHSTFADLRNSGRLLGTRDFGYRSELVFNRSTHGAHVLSLMAAHTPDTLIGTAPDASYWLLRTERVESEYPVEADLWISAAEFADSAGVDIITTSLGYTTFTDASLNYSYADLDGETIRASRAATLAAQKGIVILNAAGNEGDKAWHYIGVPADAHGIIAVGAVNAAGAAADFSSYGFIYERVKPELSAMGVSVTLANCNTVSAFYTGSGTSYSTPVLAGGVACLLQILKANHISYTPQTVIDALIGSASLYLTPDAQLGYGIPNFEMAYNAFVPTKIIENQNVANSVFIINSILTIKNIHAGERIFIYSITGQLQLSATATTEEFTLNTDCLPRGVYLVKIGGTTTKFVKQ